MISEREVTHLTLQACRVRTMILSTVSALHGSMNDARLVDEESFPAWSYAARCA